MKRSTTVNSRMCLHPLLISKSKLINEQGFTLFAYGGCQVSQVYTFCLWLMSSLLGLHLCLWWMSSLLGLHLCLWWMSSLLWFTLFAYGGCQIYQVNTFAYSGCQVCQVYSFDNNNFLREITNENYQFSDGKTLVGRSL